MNYLSNLSDDIDWKDAAAIEMAITKKIPELLASDHAFQNARKLSDPESLRVEAELAIRRAISAILSDYIELFQQFTQNRSFKERLTQCVLTRVGERHDRR